MGPLDFIGGRLIVGRDRLPSADMGATIGRSCARIHDIAGLPGYCVEFDELSIEELSLASATQKAALHLDTKRWYESIDAKQVFRFTLTNRTRFVYVFCMSDCWRSFLFPDPDPDDTTTRGIPRSGEVVTVEEIQRIDRLTDEEKKEEVEMLVTQAVDASLPSVYVSSLRLVLQLHYRNPERYHHVPGVHIERGRPSPK